MKTREYLNIGLKLIGVYFAVVGITVLAITLVNLGVPIVQDAFQQDNQGAFVHVVEGTTINLISAMQPIAYLVCAFALTRKTDWCLGLLSYPDEGKQSEKRSAK